MDAPTRFDVFELDRSALVTALGALDAGSASELGDRLSALDGHITLDLTAVSALDANGIGVLLRERVRLARAGGRLFLVGPGAPVRGLLRSAGLSGWVVDHDYCPDARRR